MFFFFFPGRDQYYRRLFLRLFCGFVVPGAPEGSTGRRFIRRSPGTNLRPLVYKASDLTTAPRRFSFLNNIDIDETKRYFMDL